MDKCVTCQYKNCKKYFVKPVLLPCSKSICQEHVKEVTDSGNKKLKCEFCKQEHQIPVDGFPTNTELEQILIMKLHLNENQKSAINSLIKFELIIKEAEKVHKDPESDIYQHFAKLKNEIDLERERLKLQIDKIALDMIDQIVQYEKECKANLLSITKSNHRCKIHLRKLLKDHSKFIEEMRVPNLNQSRLHVIVSTIEASINQIQTDIKKYELKLFLDKKCFLKIKKLSFYQDDIADFSILDNYLMKSSILTNDQAVELMKLCEFNNDKKFKLIYRATVDGFGSKDFHRKCDNKGKTLTIIKEKNNSYIFGGYTEQTWANEKPFFTDYPRDHGLNRTFFNTCNDPNAFIFSLTNKDKEGQLNCPLLCRLNAKNRPFFQDLNKRKKKTDFTGQ